MGLLFSAASCAALDASDPLQNLLREVREAEQAKDYARAASVYQRIVKLRPKDAVANRNLGLARYLQGKYSEALPSLETAVRLDPNLWTAWLYLGINRYRTNAFHKAREALDRANQLQPKQHDIQYWLGATQLALKTYPEAITHLESAVELAPRDSESLYLLARACAEYSATLLERLSKEAPQSAAAHRLRAEDALEEGMPRAALLELRKALESEPQNQALKDLYNYAAKASEQEQGAEPVMVSVETPPPAVIEEMLRNRPKDPNTIYLLGRAYGTRSKELAKRLLELDPESPRVRLMRGEAYEKGPAHDFEKALAEYQKALELGPNLAGVQYAIGRILWKMRRWDEAVPHLEKELEKNPNHGLANYYLGSSYLFLQQSDKAIMYLEAALRAQPGLVQARHDLGRAFAAGKRYEDAISCYQQLLEADPEDPSVHALMATAYKALGRLEAAHRSAELARQFSARRNKRLE